MRLSPVVFKLLLIVCCSSVGLNMLSQDEDAITCGDGLDNDWDELVDLDDDECWLSSNPACDDCPNGISFSDELISYESGCLIEDSNPEGVLGVCDWNPSGTDSPEHVFLGDQGSIAVKFNNNHLLNSGSLEPDLRIIQAGVELEFSIEVRAFDDFTSSALIDAGLSSFNNDGFYFLGSAGMLTSDIDLDQYLPGFNYGDLKFDAVRITDVGNGCDVIEGVSGVRIDAICALTSVWYSVPFTCDEKAYAFKHDSDTCGVFEIDLINGVETFIREDVYTTNVGFTPPLDHMNAFGYNPVDNKIWGVYNQWDGIVRINARLEMDSLILFEELDGYTFGVGDFSQDGIFRINAFGGRFIQIDLNPNSPTYTEIITNEDMDFDIGIDWATSPIDGNLYSINSAFEYTNHGVLEVNLNSALSSFNAAFMDGNGTLYIQASENGDIYSIHNPHLGTLEAEFLFTGVGATGSDATRCNFNIPYDCNQVVDGTAVFDDCGVCLEPDDPEFNQSCTDCAGEVFGEHVIDDCGVCLLPDDPDFNQSCSDCAGVPNGTSQIDECGECLELADPDFNQSCSDCAGVPNGTFILDECGQCLSPDDPAFNLSCTDCAGVVNGNSLIDECGECHLLESELFNQSCSDCAGVPNGTSILDECGECLEPNSAAFNQSCTDCAGNVNGAHVTDECGECLLVTDPNYNLSCADCAGVPNGESTIDLCGECWPLSSPEYNSCVDCQGTVFGDWFLNECSVCVSPEELDPNAICYEDLVFIPNSFTPDNDGTNDRFQPVFYLTPAKFKLSIYNRYGELIYYSEDPTQGWDGSAYNGDHYAPNGVYSYILQIESNFTRKTTQLSGHVSLIR